MRSQSSNSGQSSGSNDQKKSVFDRLGRQLEGLNHPGKKKVSPGHHVDHMPPPPPPPVHEADFGRYNRDPHIQAEIEWRYQNDRRHMPPFGRDGRPMSGPPGPSGPQPPPPPPPPHYEMDMRGGQPAYYPSPHPYPPPGALGGPPGMGPGGLMNMHQQRSSPKYDRHGNMIMPFKDRGPMRMGPLDHQIPNMSPPRTFMPLGPMMHPGPPHEMPPIRPAGMYLPHRWHEDLDLEFPPNPAQMVLGERFSSISPRRRRRQRQREREREREQMLLQQQQQQQQQQANLEGPTADGGQPILGNEGPRYTKWRERRDVITNLDRETAQSSSRTDSLKSTLQQSDARTTGAKSNDIPSKSNLSGPSKVAVKQTTKVKAADQQKVTQGGKDSSVKEKSAEGETDKDKEPQDISDGEIVDDEDSTDESEIVKPTPGALVTGREYDPLVMERTYLNRQRGSSMHYGRDKEQHKFYEKHGKKRRLLEREDYSMDYETISEDEDLDVFMGDKKNSDDSQLGGGSGEDGNKSLSEIELLNALGLDWANLVEMAKQSKTSGKDTFQPGSALHRFSMPNYVPTLGISPSLAGPEIYELVTRACRS